MSEAKIKTALGRGGGMMILLILGQLLYHYLILILNSLPVWAKVKKRWNPIYYFGNNIGVDPSEIYECIAPVGGQCTHNFLNHF